MDIVRYFVPDEFILFLQPQPTSSRTGLLSDAIQALRTQIVAFAKTVGISDVSIVTSFGGFDEQPNSLSGNPNVLVLKLALDFGVPSLSIPAKQARIVELAKVLQDNTSMLSNDDDKKVAGFRYASPNWFFGGAQGHQPGGGPGGRPVPYNPPGATAQKLAETPSISQPALEDLLPTLEGIRGFFNSQPQAIRGVNIVILDTAPTLDMMKQAVKRYHDNDSLRRLVGKLGVTYAGNIGIQGYLVSMTNGAIDAWKISHYDDPPEPIIRNPNDSHDLTDLKVKDYYRRYGGYKMPDHGFFIAGLIDNIVPEANLYLVQVLDDYGQGTCESVLAGLQAVERGTIYDHAGNRIDPFALPLVVNMSLCIDFSEDEVLKAFPVLGSKDEKTGIQLLKYTLMPLLSMTQRAQGKADLNAEVNSFATKADSVLVAAAGNEAEPGKTPLDARYPAAFDSVLGVAALDKSNARTWYSNRADAPPWEGISVFGGQSDVKAEFPRLKAKAILDDSLVSVYSHTHFPDENGGMTIIENTTGLAHWCGTSFATGVMSGIMAKLVLKGLPLGNRLDQINVIDVVRVMCILQGITMQGEPKFYVKQEF